MDSKFETNEEVVQAAKKALNQGAWNYLVGASESETSMRRNRLSFDKVAFRPRVLSDVSKINPSSLLLGHKLRIPVILAPIGSLQVFEPEGGVASAKAADTFGTIQTVSSVTLPSLEDISESTNSPKIFQLYVHGDWSWTEDMVDRVVEAGYKSLCVTVDTAHYSRRERPLLMRWQPPTQRRPNDRFHQAALTWETMAKIKERSGLPFMVKGIATAEDAKLAVEHGVDFVWISNHGGRQLDHCLGTMDMLPEIRDVVQDKAEIIVDGGILRGSDIVKAVASGVSAVAIGKLQAWGLAANGAQGLVRVLELLEEEMIVAMGLLGTPSVSDLSDSYVCQGDPVVLPHEMSTWVNMPFGNHIDHPYKNRML